MSDFLNQETDIPLLSQLPNKVFMSTLRMGRDYLSKNTGLDSAYNKVHSLDDRLIESTIAITDHQLCSVSSSCWYILRIMSRLWRSLICGNGEPNLSWSNPATCTPLRVHSFATIVHLVGVTSQHLARNGVTQLDGNRRWNVVTFGRILALLFDEYVLFGDQAVEKFDENYWASKEAFNTSPPKKSPTTKKSLPKRRMHFRNNYDLFNDMPPREPPKPHANEILTSTAGDLASPPQKRTLVDPVPWSSDTNVTADVCATKTERKVDSKMDFQQAFRAANADVDNDNDLHSADVGSGSFINTMQGNSGSSGNGDKSSKTQRSGASAGKAFVQAFTDTSNNRRWMTAPTNMLLTIPETEHGDDSDIELNITENDSFSTATTDFGSTGKANVADSDGFDEVVHSGMPKRTKQMRRPRRQAQAAVPENVEAVSQQPKLPEAPLLLTSDDDIETKGTAFLDTIGASIGMRYVFVLFCFCLCNDSTCLTPFFVAVSVSPARMERNRVLDHHIIVIKSTTTDQASIGL